MKVEQLIPLITSLVVSLALMGFAASIYSSDKQVATGLVVFVAGHWLGTGTMLTGVLTTPPLPPHEQPSIPASVQHP